FLPAGVPLGDRCRPGSHQDVVARGSCAQEPVHRQDGFTAIVHLAKAVPGVVARNPRPAKDSPAERHLAIHRFRSCARQSALHGDEPPARGGQAARRHQPPAFPGPGGNSPSRELGERFWWEEKQSMVWRDFPMKEENEKPVVTDVDPETHEATVESKGAEDTVSVEVVKHPFVVSVRSLLDHMRSEPKHSLLQILLSDCEREYQNLLELV